MPASPAARFRHNSWAADRARLYQALEQSAEPRSRLSRFALCGTNFQILQSTDDGNLFRVAAVRCHDRFCVPCARERSSIIASNLTDLLQNRVVRFVTLTLAHSPAPLKSQVDRLLNCFKQLRNREFWRKRVTGGVAYLELAYNAQSKLWHPHLHLLIEGRFVPQDQLRDAWHAITDDSFIVHVQAVRNLADDIGHVAKYATKPFTQAVLHDPDRLVELIAALKHRKLLYTFGTWRRFKLLTAPDAGHWHVLCDDWELSARHDLPPEVIAILLRSVRLARQTGDEAELRIPTRAPPPEQHP